MDERLLESLTPQQVEAVTHLDGPLLVVAGPGSGKTAVVTRRIAWLIHQGIPPWQILALTFTNKAAGEMRQRVEALLPPDLPGRRGLTISTFHAFAVRVLRRYAGPAGLDPRFSVYDASDQRDAVKQAIAAADLSTTNWQPGSVASMISGAKNRLLDAEGYARLASDFRERTVARIFAHYQAILRRHNALDFDDLLVRTANLLRGEGEARRELVERYQYVLVDEYQDTNHAQFVIAHALAAGHRNICVVGDPDQSIYGWRGADLGNILEFETQYPSARIVALGRNFRSTGHIVSAAAGLIGHNRRRRHKDLFTELGEGERPVLVRTRDEHHEAVVVVDFLRRRHEEGTAWKEMAILYRVNALSRVLEDALRAAAVPYTIARGTAFFERQEVKDALAYLRLIANPADAVALRRIVNLPPRGLGATTLQRLDGFAVAAGISLLEALRRAGEVPGLGARAAAAATRFHARVRGWEESARSAAAPLADLVDAVIRESGLEEHHRSRGTDEERQERGSNLAELVSAAAQHQPPEEEGGAAPSTLDALRGFLESVVLVSDADAVDPAQGSVTLMTLHTAKGLEFAAVALAGLEQGLLPHRRFAEESEDVEEERRLCYVGMTRARRHLLLTSSAVRTQRGVRERTMMSQFIREIPAASISFSDQSDPLGDDFYGADDADDFGGRRGGAGTGAGTGPRRERRGDGAGYQVGCRVRHPSFGLGWVAALTPRPVGSAVRVVFDRGGVKTLILEYARLERVD
jgi:DNA helicase-2/ATP-dependent DNA helicase PcrA